MSCWRSFGSAEFLDSCLRGLIVLVACIWCSSCLFWTDVVDTLPGSGLVDWCLESVFFARTQLQILSRTHCQLGIDRGTALQFQPSRLASKILPHPYIFCFVAISTLEAASKPALKLAARLILKIVFLLQVRMVENRSCNRGCKCLFPVLQKARCFALTLLSPLRI